MFSDEIPFFKCQLSIFTAKHNLENMSAAKATNQLTVLIAPL